jgi:hypothetical protein
MLKVREYLNEDGVSPFADWFTGLDAIAAAKFTAVLARIGQGNGRGSSLTPEASEKGCLSFGSTSAPRLPGVFRPRR